MLYIYYYNLVLIFLKKVVNSHSINKQKLMKQKLLSLFLMLVCSSSQIFASQSKLESEIENELYRRENLIISASFPMLRASCNNLKDNSSNFYTSEKEEVTMHCTSDNIVVIENPYLIISFSQQLCSGTDSLLFSFKNKINQNIVLTVSYDGKLQEVKLKANEEKTATCENGFFQLDIDAKSFKKELLNVIKIESE